MILCFAGRFAVAFLRHGCALAWDRNQHSGIALQRLSDKGLHASHLGSKAALCIGPVLVWTAHAPSALCPAARAENHSFGASTFSAQDAAKQRARQSGTVSATHGYFRIIMDRDNPLAWACLQEAVFSSKTFRLRIVSKAAQVPGPGIAGAERSPEASARSAFAGDFLNCLGGRETRLSGKAYRQHMSYLRADKGTPFSKGRASRRRNSPPRKRRTWHCIPCQHTNTGADSHGKTFLKNF